jgi:hypothetical protein
MPPRETIARSGPLWLLVPLVAGIALGCRSSSGDSANLEHAAEAIASRTIPPGAKALVRTGPIRGEWDVRWGLEFETEWDWETYKKWVRSQLEPEFRLLKGTQAQFVFSKAFRGDAQSIIIDRVSESDSTRVRVSITNYPD